MCIREKKNNKTNKKKIKNWWKKKMNNQKYADLKTKMDIEMEYRFLIL